MKDSVNEDVARRRLGDFEIQREIGRGGMGVVYEARQVSLNRKVALKVLSVPLGLNSKAVQRFHREAEAAAKLHHTNIVPIYATGADDQTHYYAMELIEGPSLDRVIRELKRAAGHDVASAPSTGTSSDAEPCDRLNQTTPYDGETGASAVATQTLTSLGSGSDYFDAVAGRLAEVADALEYAHCQGVIHRDIKPSNLLWSPNGRLSINDFGLARMLEQPGMTMTGEFVGTPRYMSPEQIAAGRAPLDHRTDIYSLGATLYELLTMMPPFAGPQREQLLAQIMYKEPRAPRRVNPKVPLDLETICLKALEKDPDRRYQTAGQMAEDLRRFTSRYAISARRAGPLLKLAKFVRRNRLGVTAAVLIVLFAAAAGVGAWQYWRAQANLRAEQQRAEGEQWVREQAIPSIRRLVGERDYPAAFALFEKARGFVPDDPSLLELASEVSHTWAVVSNPPGADVYCKPFGLAEADWKLLGPAPVQHVRLPRGPIHWRLSLEGHETVEGCRAGHESVARFTLPPSGSVPAGMVRVAGNAYRSTLYGMEALGLLDLDDYLIDRYEVTNWQFKEFIDSGGYQKPEYWKHPFVKGEETISRQAAMSEFRDATGMPGPASWQAGTYPEQQDHYPVRGVSWYEAAAYAEFAGKSLPTVAHWVRAAGLVDREAIAAASNFGGSGPVAVGSLPGVGPFGTRDTAGNVKEWCWNKAERNRRYILGGAWDEPTYMFFNWEAYAAMERRPTYGFRCVKYLPGPIPPGALADLLLERPDYRKVKPVSEEQFQFTRGLFAYDKGPLNAAVVSRQELAQHIHETIRFDAASGAEKVPGHLYLPREAAPPYQTVIYFPGAGAFSQTAFPRDDPPRDVAFLVQSGRAVLWPVYKGTYERSVGGFRGANHRREVFMQAFRDYFRALDYLEQRSDIDAARLAYVGHSNGGWMGIILLALDRRPKVAVFNSGGLTNYRPPFPEIDPINAVPRFNLPIRMINGDSDTVFAVETNQRPLFELLGTPQEHKSHIIVPGAGHGLPIDVLAREALPWLDKYLGPVRRQGK